MIGLPGTSWMVAAAACAIACAVALSVWIKIRNGRERERNILAAKFEYQMAEAEVYAAVRSGDANRSRHARLRLQAAKAALRRYGIG